MHLFIDSILDNNPSNGIGVAILWPLSNAMFSPFNMLTPEFTKTGWTDINLKTLMNSIGRIYIVAIPLYLSVLFILFWDKLHKVSKYIDKKS